MKRQQNEILFFYYLIQYFQKDFIPKYFYNLLTFSLVAQLRCFLAV